MQTTNKRVQRRRTRGWRMPKNTIYVGRGTRWGNPYKFQDYLILDLILEKYEDWLKKKLEEDKIFLNPLRGKNLACFCSLDRKCHVDILLKYIYCL